MCPPAGTATSSAFPCRTCRSTGQCLGERMHTLLDSQSGNSPTSPQGCGCFPCLQWCISACCFSRKTISTQSPLLQKIKTRDVFFLPVYLAYNIQDSRLLHYHLNFSFCPKSLVRLRVAYDTQRSVINHPIPSISLLLCFFHRPPSLMS